MSCQKLPRSVDMTLISWHGVLTPAGNSQNKHSHLSKLEVGTCFSPQWWPANFTAAACRFENVSRGLIAADQVWVSDISRLRPKPESIVQSPKGQPVVVSEWTCETGQFSLLARKCLGSDMYIQCLTSYQLETEQAVSGNEWMSDKHESNFLLL